MTNQNAEFYSAVVVNLTRLSSCLFCGKVVLHVVLKEALGEKRATWDVFPNPHLTNNLPVFAKGPNPVQQD